jgi:CHASE1-domain containing sensor protein
LRWFRSLVLSSAAPGWLLAFGLLTAVGLTLGLRALILNEAEREFQNLVERAQRAYVQRIEAAAHGLRGLVGSMAVQGGPLSRSQHRAYVESRNIDAEFPGLRGLGLIDRVASADLAGYVAEQREEGFANFEVRTLTPAVQDPAYVIRSIEPISRNLAAIGVDVGSEARRRTGVEAAIDRGQPTLCAPITLVQEQERTPGFLLFLAAYRYGRDVESVADRRRALAAVAYAPLVARELFADLPELLAGRLQLRLMGGPQNAELVHAVQPAGADAYTARLRSTARFELYGQAFVLEARSAPALEAGYSLLPAYLVGLLAALLSVGMAAWLRQMGDAQQRTEHQVQLLTAESRRLAAVAQRTSNAVVITGLDRRIEWVNPGFERITGYSLQEGHRAHARRAAAMPGDRRRRTAAAQRGPQRRPSFPWRAAEPRQARRAVLDRDRDPTAARRGGPAGRLHGHRVRRQRAAPAPARPAGPAATPASDHPGGRHRPVVDGPAEPAFALGRVDGPAPRCAAAGLQRRPPMAPARRPRAAARGGDPPDAVAVAGRRLRVRLRDRRR